MGKVRPRRPSSDPYLRRVTDPYPLMGTGALLQASGWGHRLPMAGYG